MTAKDVQDNIIMIMTTFFMAKIQLILNSEENPTLNKIFVLL